LYLGELAGQHFSLVIVGALLVTMSISRIEIGVFIWNLCGLAPTLLIKGVSGVEHVLVSDAYGHIQLFYFLKL